MAPRLICSRLWPAGEHFHAHSHGIVEFRSRRPCSQVRDGVLDHVSVGREILQFVDRVVEAHHGRFTSRPHHSLREQNARFANLRHQGLDTRACLDQNHHGYWVAAEIEVGDLLSNAIIGNPKIFRFQIVNHLATAIAHRHRRVHQSDPHSYLGLRVLRGQLDFDAGLGSDGTGGGLRASGVARNSQKER